MIKLEHVVLASPEQMEFIIQGMRNPHNSWDKSDSNDCNKRCIDCYLCPDTGDKDKDADLIVECYEKHHNKGFILGENDHSLMQRLANAGTDNRKFMRMMPVYVRITAPLYWWKEFDTYKVATVANSCSTMHKIQEKEFTLEDFSTEHLFDCYGDPSMNLNYGYKYPKAVIYDLIDILNNYRVWYKETKDKKYWWQMIQLLPSSYNQTRNVMMNYEVLCNIYKSRKSHRLDEWVEFCKWIEELPYSELIVGKEED